jgi:hypothetical protein
MNLCSSYLHRFFLFTLLTTPLSTFAQVDSFSKIINSTFPGKWDTNRDLRGRNGRVLAWTHIRSNRKNESKSCITLVFGPDSTGNIEYFISEMFTNKKPFKNWNHAWVYRQPAKPDSASGLRIGLFYIHLKRFDHKPTEDELYGLFAEWNFHFFEKDSKTFEAGVDEKLWFNTFGFIPDREKIVKKE